jgi:hypothetical protein
MEPGSAPYAKPIPIHVGFAQPQPDDPNGPARNPRFKLRKANSPLRGSDFEWARHTVEPRWLTMESSDCVAALEPSIFTNHGGVELDRFLAGAASRNEIALVIATIGDLEDDQPAFPSKVAGDSLLLPGVRQQIAGARLPKGASASLAPDLSDADRDLGLRLLNSHPPDAPWWGLSLHGMMLESGTGDSAIRYEPTGHVNPILIDGLGHPVVASWTPESGEQRWYLIPDGSDWHTVLDWLEQQALPEYVPDVLRRARSPLARDEDLQTPAEASSHQALADLRDEYEEARQRIESRLHETTAAADPIRNGLLYGTGAELERAVAATLIAAGFTVTELDAHLGDTSSADLLASYGPDRRLVEVKSASGSPSESLVTTVQRHLQTWPELSPDEPVGGGALIVNHQHRREPSDRTPAVYSRPEFVAALTMPVLSTLQLFHWWRDSDWAALRNAVLAQTTSDPDAAAPVHATTTVPAATPGLETVSAVETRSSRWWRQLRQRDAGA